MDSIRIQGGVALQGKVRIQGSKNAALPVLAATLLVGDRSFIGNCPRIADVYAMISLLQSLGCRVTWQKHGITVDSSSIRREEMRSEAVTGMRSSVCLLGALLGRCGEAVMEHPGGCVIGKRPIDLHLAALGSMGVRFEERDGMLHAEASQLHGADITLPRPSVGATENILLAAVMAEGQTLIRGAAAEPEVGALCSFLKQCGADIEGVGTDCLTIRGGAPLYGTSYAVPADRIVAGTYLLGCMGTGGSVFLEAAPAHELGEVMRIARELGGRVYSVAGGIYVQAPQQLKGIKSVSTAPYPGFPTDLQSVLLTVLTAAPDDTVIHETIFEDRFRVVGELKRMGAEIELTDGQHAVVHPAGELHGAAVKAQELRGGAALVVAGLMAKGETVVEGCPFIYRGYENICRDFRELGARISSV